MDTNASALCNRGFSKINRELVGTVGQLLEGKPIADHVVLMRQPKQNSHQHARLLACQKSGEFFGCWLCHRVGVSIHVCGGSCQITALVLFINRTNFLLRHQS